MATDGNAIPTASEIAAALDAARPGTTPVLRTVRRGYSRTLRGVHARDVIALASNLSSMLPQERKWVAYELVRFHAGAFKTVTLRQIEALSRELDSWYAVDGFGTILVGPLWARGRLPDALPERWSRSSDRWLRRSSLVATVGLNALGSGQADRSRDAERTLAICSRLAGDRDDMVEKALSWALRVLSDRDRGAVERFMEEHDPVLAARVRREVRRKLETGTKNRPRGASEAATRTRAASPAWSESAQPSFHDGGKG